MRIPRPPLPGTWTLIAAATLLALVLAVVTQRDSLADEWIAAVCELAAAARLAGHARGAHRIRWGLLAAGVGLYGLASLWYAAFVAANPDSSYGSVADALWLGSYLPLAGALVAIVHRSFGARDTEAVLDGCIAALGAAALGTAIVVPALAHAGASPLTVVVTLGYPVMDLLLLGIALGGIVLAGRLTPSWRRLGGSLLLLACSDMLFASQVTAGGGAWTLGGVMALGSPLAFWLMASATPDDHDVADPGRSHLFMPVVPLVASVVAMGVLLADHWAPVPVVALLLAAAAVALAVARTAWTIRANAHLQDRADQAMRDELTGLSNRRRLLADLDLVARDASRSAMLVLFDLDGFKAYNDAYGHPAGDGLLAALGQRLRRAVAGQGDAYRLGGDEFCILIGADDVDHQLVLDRALDALQQDGDGFSIGASYGRVTVPDEAPTSSAALQLADTRMYQRKDATRASTRRQSRDLLLQLLHEQQPDLEEHSGDVGELVGAVGRRLGMDADALDHARHAAELHDVGKVAIPAAILTKPGPLDDDEWTLMKRHTIIGERILCSVPALVPVGRIVRATHERWDGDGYPDGLRGEEIPLGARVIAVCDTFHAITSDRPYRQGRPAEEALAELRRCAHTQFDPAVVEAFAAELAAGTLTMDAAASGADEGGDARRVAPAGAVAQHAAGELAQLAKLRGLLHATQLARGGADIAEVLDAIARTIGSSLGFRVVSINLFRPEWDDFVCTAVQGDDAVRDRLLGHSKPADSWRPLLQERFARDGAYFLPAGAVEFDDDITWHVPDIEPTEDPGAWQADDMLLVPLRGDHGEILGMVSVDEPVWGRRPGDAAVEVLVAVAEHAALALQSARSSAIGRAARTAGHRVADLGPELVSATDAGQVAAAVATCVREALAFESVEVELVASALDAELLEELLAGVDADGGTAVLAGEAAWKARAWRGIGRSSRNGRGAQAWNDHMAVAVVRGAERELLAVVWCDDPKDRLLPHASTLRLLRQIAAQAIVPLAWGRRVPAPEPNL